MDIVTLFYGFFGLLMVALAIPLIRQMVSPNSWYGLRIQVTLENEQIWYPSNVYVGKLLLVYGLLIVAMVILYALLPEHMAETCAILVSAFLVVGIIVIGALGIRYANRLVKSVVQPGEDGNK